MPHEWLKVTYFDLVPAPSTSLTLSPDTSRTLWDPGTPNIGCETVHNWRSSLPVSKDNHQHQNKLRLGYRYAAPRRDLPLLQENVSVKSPFLARDQGKHAVYTENIEHGATPQ